jgi:hypothetical protein
MQPVTFKEFAKIKGVTLEAVRRAIETKRLVNCLVYNPRYKKPKIDPAVAMQEWEKNTDHSRRFRGNDIRTVTRAAPYIKPDVNRPDEAPQAGGPTLNESRAITEAYRARMAKIEYEEKIGSLVEAAKVKEKAFQLGRVLRDSLIGIPDRISGELAGLSDSYRIHEIITAEIRNAIEGVIDETV